MSIYTSFKKVVADRLIAGQLGVIRVDMEDQYEEDSDGNVIVIGRKPVKYLEVCYKPLGVKADLEVMEDGSLFTANRYAAIAVVELLWIRHGVAYYHSNVFHDNDSYWDATIQDWMDAVEFQLKYTISGELK